MKIVCFHNPNEENGYLSNWYPSRFTVNNEDLNKQLKATENCVLAECAVKDKIRGIGLSMKDPKRFEIEKWNGQNMLGYALMMVRERL